MKNDEGLISIIFRCFFIRMSVDYLIIILGVTKFPIGGTNSRRGAMQTTLLTNFFTFYLFLGGEPNFIG